jgi:hypothetical protein
MSQRAITVIESNANENHDTEPINESRGNSMESQILANHMNEILSQLNRSVPSAISEIDHSSILNQPHTPPNIPEPVMNSSLSENTNSNAEADLNSGDES